MFLYTLNLTAQNTPINSPLFLHSMLSNRKPMHFCSLPTPVSSTCPFQWGNKPGSNAVGSTAEEHTMFIPRTAASAGLAIWGSCTRQIAGAWVPRATHICHVKKWQENIRTEMWRVRDKLTPSNTKTGKTNLCTITHQSKQLYIACSAFSERAHAESLTYTCLRTFPKTQSLNSITFSTIRWAKLTVISKEEFWFLCIINVFLSLSCCQ